MVGRVNICLLHWEVKETRNDKRLPTMGPGAPAPGLEAAWPPHRMNPGARAEPGSDEARTAPGLRLARHTREGAACEAAPEAWGPALLAGLLGLASVLLLQGVLSRLVTLPQQRDLDVSRYPAVTVLMWVVMSAVVAGIVEETSFRGYLLGMVLHAGGNMFSAFNLFTRGRSEWQLSPKAKPLIWETGPDLALWGNVAALLIVAALTVWAYSTLARAARKARASSAG